MRNRAILFRRRAYVEEPQHWRQISLTGRSKIPVRKCLVCIFASVRGAVTPQYRGRIVFGIEADTQQMRLLVEIRIGLKRLIDLREVAAHPRTEISQRATRIDKRHQQYLATKLREADLLVALIQQVKVRKLIARLNRMIKVTRLIVRLGLSNDDDFIEQIRVACRDQSSRNAVARM